MLRQNTRMTVKKDPRSPNLLRSTHTVVSVKPFHLFGMLTIIGYRKLSFGLLVAERFDHVSTGWLKG